MSELGLHKVFPPISLAAADLTNNARCVDLGEATGLTVQAALLSNPTYLVHFRIRTDNAGAETSLATAEHCLGHLGSRTIRLCESAKPQHSYLYVFVTTSTGTGANGGASDQLNVLAVV